MSQAIQKRLKAGKATIGSWMQLPNASVAEIMGKAGFDWVALDLEHGAFSVESLPDLCRALELGGTVPFARVAQNSCKDIKQAIEAGARGIIVPMIESRLDMEQAVTWSKYPPAGQRGIGYSRANLFGKQFQSHFAEFNDDLVLVAQIESIGAVHALDEILRVKGVDAILIGPYDLSGSMGHTGRFDHPEFVAALALARAKAKQHGIPMGLHVVQPDPAALHAKIAEGYQFIAYGIDAVFLYQNAVNPVHLGK